MRELNTALQATITEKDSIKGTMGVGVDYYKGKDGYTPIKGVDYFTEEDIAEIKKGIEGADLSEYPKKKDLATVATSGSYTDLKDKPTFNGDYNSLTNKPELFSGSYNDLTNKPELFSGDYNDLTNKPSIPEIPDLTGYAKKTEIPSLTGYVKAADLSTVATTGSYNDLDDKPAIPDAYTLPVASTDTLGGVKVDGETITISDGVISSTGGGGSSYNDTFVYNDSLNADAEKVITITNDFKIGDKNNFINSPGTICLGYKNAVTTKNDNIMRSILIVGNGHFLNNYALSNSAFIGRKNDGQMVDSLCIGDQNTIRWGVYNCLVAGQNNLFIGASSTANFKSCSMIGYNLINDAHIGHYFGQFNLATANEPLQREFVIGNGTSDSKRSNALSVDMTGNLAIAGTMSSAGADYAEFFEWKDGNPTAQDRVGYIVTLDGDKLTLANEGDYILGVVSGTATVLGDNPEWNWAKRWVTDDFGRIQYENVTVHHNAEETIDRTIPAWDEVVKTPVVNPEYDPDQSYTRRADRKEWDAVGMMGKLYVRDDGTCQVNGYAKPVNGVATASTSGTMRVIERISDNVIKVVIK